MIPKRLGQYVISNNAVRSVEDTVAYMREHGMPEANAQLIMQIEQRALRKLRHHPDVQMLHKELCHA